MTLRVFWLAYGTLEQPTGGYVYDRLIVEKLREHGVLVVERTLIPDSQISLAITITQIVEGDVDVVVGDALCINELGPLFEALVGRVTRVLLVHHLGSWELEVSAMRAVALRAQELRAVNSADVIVTTSHTTARRLCAEYRQCAPYTIVPGADRLECRPRSFGRTEFHLLGIGSLIARKRWVLLLTALEQLSTPELHLRLVGDATREPDYSRALAKQIAESTHLSGHVEYLGVINDEALSLELAAADALVLPSSLEGYGLVLTEALHAGLPIIASRSGAIPEVLMNTDAALLFEDDSELVSQLNLFVREPKLRNTLMRAAFACKASLPTWKNAGSRFLEVLTLPI